MAFQFDPKDVRAPGQYDVDQASLDSALKFDYDVEGEHGRTSQEFKEEADINTIVRRFGLTGELPDDFRAPLVGDFTDVVDYQTALNAVIAARDSFMELPADLRERFVNDPQRLMDFLADDRNRDEAIKLGLVKAPPPPPAPPAPQEVVIVEKKA